MSKYKLYNRSENIYLSVINPMYYVLNNNNIVTIAKILLVEVPFEYKMSYYKEIV